MNPLVKKPSDAIFLAATAALVVVIKLHYRAASAADLKWILAPTVWLVELFGGAPFQWTREGYFSQPLHYLIAPACAGINFLVVAFSGAMLSQVSRLAQARLQALWLGFVLVASYALTLLANAARILLAIELHRRGIRFGWFTPPRVHQTEGVILYLATLMAFSILTSRLMDKFAPEATLR